MGKQKEKVGVVTSDKMHKTRVVKLERLVKYPLYNKTVKKFSKVKAEDAKNESKVGDKVRIRETRPLSKEKRWRIVEMIK
ncbi:MAG: 30S ribosomal protein S17 [Candidatus Omnitrophica bacterium]|nr:30S ribosomal protein S17 [Candidatus Omnitrophota bacterium]